MQEVNWYNCSFAWLENEYGRFLSIDGLSHHKQYESMTYQPYINSLIQSNEYDLFVDCGAFIGIFSLVGAKHCQKVISYEASPFLFGILAFNLRYQFNVDCRYTWIGKKEQIPKSKKEELHMVTRGRDFEYNIPVAELDNEILPLIKGKTLIKIDIEGNEINALERASELIKLTNVHWVIDCHQEITPNDIKKYFNNRHIYNAANVIVIKGDKSEPNDPIFKGWKRVE